MKEAEALVADFHKRFGIPIGGSWDIKERRRLRRELLWEEYCEYGRGEGYNDLVEVADGLADLIYVAIGTALEYGIPITKIFREVHRTNMNKVATPNGGKIGKPTGWQPPNILEILADKE